MNIFEKLIGFIKNKRSGSVPLLIIKKERDDANVKEYRSIEEAIADLEADANVPAHKIEKIRASLNSLKNRTSIKIKNGEIVK